MAGDAAPGALALEGSGMKRFRLRASWSGRFGLYTQHRPSELDLVLRHQGRELEPVASYEFAAGHTHDAEVSSVGIHLEGAIDGNRLNAWLSSLLREKGADIFRMKGILDIAGSDHRFVFQGVHMLLDGSEQRPWGDEPRASDLVFIGRKLDREALTRGFERCRA
jgi:G3E family GTPase